jgi:hypothetical protein
LKKNFENDQIKSEKEFKQKLTLLISFCLLLVASKTNYKKTSGEREYHLGKHELKVATSKQGVATSGTTRRNGGERYLKKKRE